MALSIQRGPLLYTVAESAIELRVCRATIYKLIRAGKLESVKIGSSRRIPGDALTAYIRGLRSVKHDA